MKFIIDRFEDQLAVIELEDGSTLSIPRKLVPDGKEGDIVRLVIEKDETQARRTNIEKLMDDLWED